MKHFLLSFILSVLATTIYGQDTVDSVYISKKYHYDFYNHYHFSKDCPKLKSWGESRTVALNDVKREYIKCSTCMPRKVKEQELKNTFTGPDDNRLYKANEYFRTSANLRFSALGLGVAGAAATFGILQTDLEKKEEIAYGIGGACILAAAICEIVSIAYVYKGGKALVITPNSIKINF